MLHTPSQNHHSTEKFETFRKGFPAFENSIYFSICYRSILHRDVRAAMDVFLDDVSYFSPVRVDHEAVVASSRDKFAALINAEPSSIAASRSVADGINAVAWAFPFQPGDNVIIAMDHEHPSNIYPWLRLAKTGVKLKQIPSQSDGRLDIEAMIAAIDNDTKLLTCASVNYAPGQRADLRRLGEACRARNVFFLVDGIQSAGILKHDVQDELIDGFAVSTSKGLLGTYGYGFIYISPNWIERLDPVYLSQAAININACCHAVKEDDHYTLWPDSRRMEVTGYNYVGAYAADKALDLLLALRAEDIERYVLSLATALYDGVTELGLETVSAGDGRSQSSVFTIGPPLSIASGCLSDPKLERMSDHLKEAHIVHSIRRGQLRFGLHAYNTLDDVHTTLACLKDAIAS